MREDLKERLARAFDTPEGAARAGATADPHAAEDQFKAAFLRKAERLVYPAMLEVGRMIERHGRFFSIELMRERTTCHGVVLPTSMQMNFFRRSHTANFKNQCPHFNVSCEAAERRIAYRFTAHAPAGERVTDCGRSTLDQLRRDLVQEKLVAALDAILRA